MPPPNGAEAGHLASILDVREFRRAVWSSSGDGHRNAHRCHVDGASEARGHIQTWASSVEVAPRSRMPPVQAGRSPSARRPGSEAQETAFGYPLRWSPKEGWSEGGRASSRAAPTSPASSATRRADEVERRTTGSAIELRGEGLALLAAREAGRATLPKRQPPGCRPACPRVKLSPQLRSGLRGIAVGSPGTASSGGALSEGVTERLRTRGLRKRSQRLVSGFSAPAKSPLLQRVDPVPASLSRYSTRGSVIPGSSAIA